jgi:hypothetical protein
MPMAERICTSIPCGERDFLCYSQCEKIARHFLVGRGTCFQQGEVDSLDLVTEVELRGIPVLCILILSEI